MSVRFGGRHLPVRVGAIGLAVALAVALGASGVLTPQAQRTAAGASTTLTILSGAVAIRTSGRDFSAARDGAVLVAGDTVRTGTDGRAVLTYFEGTTVEIEPASELTIDEAGAGTDGGTVLLMTQSVGRTWHVVTHLLSGNSRYEVRTPAATASVRGTQFEVAVTAEATTVTTSEGRVATSDPAKIAEVLVTPGLTTTTRKGEVPTAPAPAPEPQRRVTVTVSDPDTLVVDPLGRANGFKDGKPVVQSPGASVRVVEGRLVVTLPNMPDGTLAASTGRKGAEIETTVADAGAAPVTVTASGSGPVGVKVQAVNGARPSVEATKGDRKVDLPKPKVGRRPAGPPDAASGASGTGPDAKAPDAKVPDAKPAAAPEASATEVKTSDANAKTPAVKTLAAKTPAANVKTPEAKTPNGNGKTDGDAKTLDAKTLDAKTGARMSELTEPQADDAGQGSGKKK